MESLLASILEDAKNDKYTASQKYVPIVKTKKREKESIDKFSEAIQAPRRVEETKEQAVLRSVKRQKA